jgi:hypothetical protein
MTPFFLIVIWILAIPIAYLAAMYYAWFFLGPFWGGLVCALMLRYTYLYLRACYKESKRFHLFRIK